MSLPPTIEANLILQLLFLIPCVHFIAFLYVGIQL